jgi:hypothetical protein
MPSDSFSLGSDLFFMPEDYMPFSSSFEFRNFVGICLNVSLFSSGSMEINIPFLSTDHDTYSTFIIF